MFRVIKRVLYQDICYQVEVDFIPFSYMSSRGTTEVICALQQLQEVRIQENNLKKAFNDVHLNVLRCVIRTLGVEEWAISIEAFIYKHGSPNQDGVGQGSVMSPLMFITVKKIPPRTFLGNCPLKHLYVDNQVILAESIIKFGVKLPVWKSA